MLSELFIKDCVRMFYICVQILYNMDHIEKLIFYSSYPILGLRLKFIIYLQDPRGLHNQNAIVISILNKRYEKL